MAEEGYSLESVADALKTVFNVASKSFGTSAIPREKPELGPRLYNLIYRNTRIPMEVTQSFATICDNQERVSFDVLENSADKPVGDAEIAKVNRFGIEVLEGTELWKDELPLPPGMKKDSELQVTFAMDANGLLKVICRDPKSGRKIETELKTGAVLTREEEKKIKQRQAVLAVE